MLDTELDSLLSPEGTNRNSRELSAVARSETHGSKIVPISGEALPAYPYPLGAFSPPTILPVNTNICNLHGELFTTVEELRATCPR